MKSGILKSLLLLAATLVLQACTSQQAYGSLQAWQQQECFRMNDPQERSRCLSNSSKSYDDYRRESEAIKK